MSNPDIQSPSFLKLLIIWGGGTLVVMGIVVGGIMFYDQSQNVSELSGDLEKIFQKGLPDDFFTVDDSEESINTDKPDILVVDDEAVKDAEAPKTIVKVVYRDSPKPKPKPKPESVTELFGAQEVAYSAVKQEIRQLNLDRRGTGETFTQLDKEAGFSKVVGSKDKDWQPYGIAKDFASYPVDLGRVITVDRNIRCILIEEISSELEGKITCRVEENVYGAHGRFVLIPAGSVAIGYYLPLRKVGETRLLAGWRRIITPDGINVNLSSDDDTGAQLSDAMGRSGITGDIDNKYLEKYGLAFAVATINAVASANYVAENANQQIIIENYGREIGQLSNTILQENIDIKPTVTIPAGSRILISPLIDIWFKPPKNKEILISTLPQEGSS